MDLVIYTAILNKTLKNKTESSFELINTFWVSSGMIKLYHKYNYKYNRYTFLC